MLAQFFFADECLNVVAQELDSFDGRKEPERCSALVAQLRQAQDRVLGLVGALTELLLGAERAPRDFRAKFPEDVLQDNLAGQLWFGAECLAAGSSILHREPESAEMRPLARALTKTLEQVRGLVREACLRSTALPADAPLCARLAHDDRTHELLVEKLRILDRLFAEFELRYVSAMVPVKSAREHELQQLLAVLFSETAAGALRSGLLAQEALDERDPALMLAIPRLALVRALRSPHEPPLHLDGSAERMSDMFRPFRALLRRLRRLVRALDRRELRRLERLLCDSEGGAAVPTTTSTCQPDRPGTPTDEAEPQLEAVSAQLCSMLPRPGACSNGTSDSSEDDLEEEDPRARFPSPDDLLHRLFVCVSGVADQLQTNFASDLRDMLRAVFAIHGSAVAEDRLEYRPPAGAVLALGSAGEVPVAQDALLCAEEHEAGPPGDGPAWVPDVQAPRCMACAAPFTVVKRRHHCRNCGKVFCARCSSNSVPLPRLGHMRPVRVCNRCFVYHLAPFTV